MSTSTAPSSSQPLFSLLELDRCKSTQ